MYLDPSNTEEIQTNTEETSEFTFKEALYSAPSTHLKAPSEGVLWHPVDTAANLFSISTVT